MKTVLLHSASAFGCRFVSFGNPTPAGLVMIIKCVRSCVSGGVPSRLFSLPPPTQPRANRSRENYRLFFREGAFSAKWVMRRALHAGNINHAAEFQSDLNLFLEWSFATLISDGMSTRLFHRLVHSHTITLISSPSNSGSKEFRKARGPCSIVTIHHPVEDAVGDCRSGGDSFQLHVASFTSLEHHLHGTPLPS